MTEGLCALLPKLCRIGPLQVASHVVQKHVAGEQETHWDKSNKELTLYMHIISNGNFLCLSCPSVFLAHQQGVILLYHVTGHCKGPIALYKISLFIDYWFQRLILPGIQLL